MPSNVPMMNPPKLAAGSATSAMIMALTPAGNFTVGRNNEATPHSNISAPSNRVDTPEMVLMVTRTSPTWMVV